MSDTYQAVYDAIRSRFQHCDAGEAIKDVLRAAGIDHQIYSACESIRQSVCVVQEEHTRPSVLFRPALSIDGNMWSALYGANLQDGVAGFGESPDKAMRDFDKNWQAAIDAAKEQTHD